MKKFYSHLVEIESLVVELETLNLSVDEKHKLAELIDSNLHHTILDAILSELSEEDKKTFMEHLTEGSHDKIWNHLNDKIENIEDKIKTAAQGLKEQLKKDVKDAKRLKREKK